MPAPPLPNHPLRACTKHTYSAMNQPDAHSAQVKSPLPIPYSPLDARLLTRGIILNENIFTLQDPFFFGGGVYEAFI